MDKGKINIRRAGGTVEEIEHCRSQTLVIGSGAAGLAAAVQLRRHGVQDVVILTEGLDKGTSINTGSDKQTYYKLSLCGDDADSPVHMAKTFFDGGGMHGDIAMVEAAVSARAFLNLVELGVKFPHDKFGQYAGYKTDHDPRRRATSVGPYTSRDMCRALIDEVRRLHIPVIEGVSVASLVTAGEGEDKRALGVVVFDAGGVAKVYSAASVVFAAGGPGGLYRDSVYPGVHTGAIGVALMAGAKARNLPEAQFGLASTKFRWNVSGTYMQVIPKFISTDPDGGDEREFLAEYFADTGAMNSQVFLKGYQWPFDCNKACGGSSLIDILVYVESVVKGRKVFLDFRANPDGFDFASLSDESREYLEKSDALQDTPFARLMHMNPGAVELYRNNGLDIEHAPLQIAVSAQHNNGGLAANMWWESENIKRLFPIGEINGSHGVCRPGGSALNSGQVGAIRAAEFIAARYGDEENISSAEELLLSDEAAKALDWLENGNGAEKSWGEERRELMARMSDFGGAMRSSEKLTQAVSYARSQWERVSTRACAVADAGENIRSLETRQLCYAHLVYLEAILYSVQSGVGSRGSAAVLAEDGECAHKKLGDGFKMLKEDASFRDKVLETFVEGATISHEWVKCRPLPDAADIWFENVWADFRDGKIYHNG